MMVRSLWKEVALVGCVAAAGSVFGMGGAAFAVADASAAAGVVSNIKIMSDKNPDDMSSVETWKKAYIKDGMSDQDKAIAVWRTVTKYRHQDNPPNEGIESTGNVHEPMKTFNVYGYGMCCCAAADIEGLNRYIGLVARGRIINNHSVPEVWYSDSWHLFDASLTFFLQKPGADGTPATGLVASVDEMKADIMAWRKQHPELHNDSDVMKYAKDEGWKNGPTLFATADDSPSGKLYHFYSKDGWCRAEAPGIGQGTTNHGWNSNMSEYNYKHPDEKTKMMVVPPDTNPTWNVYDYGAIMGYQVNVELREGEKLTRCWYADEAATGINRNNPKRYVKFLEGDMTGLSLQKDMGDLAPGRIGNGTLEYDAMADSKLAGDALACENLKVEGGKIRIVDATKPGTLIVRMPCSYLYLNGEMTSSPVVNDGGSVKASISVNNGLDWKDLATFDKSGEQKTDLKPVVYNKYDYRVKLEFAGAGAGLDALKFVNKVQHSQAPLPIITEGDNKLTFTAGQVAEGTVTVQGNMKSEGATESKDDLGKPLMMADFHPEVDGVNMKFFGVGNTGHGTAIVPITTPGDITRLRLGIHWRAREVKDGYTITASFDNGQTWKDVSKLDLANPAKSTYIVFSDVPAGSKTVQVKFDGTQHNTAAIFDLRIDADYKEPAGGFRPVKVTYTWEEGVPEAKAAAAAAVAAAKGKDKAVAIAAAEKVHGTPKSDEHVYTKPDDTWMIHCGPGTVVKSYTVELAK